MSLIEDELGDALSSSVKRKNNGTRKLGKAKRVAQGTTEVMVKVTGYGKGAGHVKAHLDYISRNGNVELETSQGEVLSGRAEVGDFFKDWATTFERDEGKNVANRRDTMHMVLSMPETVDSESVKNAVRAFAKNTFGGNHEYVFALHTDEPHPHCHLTVKCRGFDGSQLRTNPVILEAWREGFAEQLREQGVDAEATPRHSRGVLKKAETGVVRHIAAGDKTHKPRVPKVKAAKIKEAAQELAAEAKGTPAPEHPQAAKARASIEKKRKAWLSVAEALETTDTRLTFNNQEAKNARPDYDRIAPGAERAAQRRVALYQSNPKALGRTAPPGTLPGVRNLSGCAVVHHKRASKMLLPANAPDRMGWQGNADPEMRWSRVSDTRTLGAEERLAGRLPPSAENKVVAANIRTFVASMPAPTTERQEIKERLAERFTRAPDAAKSTGLPAPAVEQQKSADNAAPSVKPRDVER